MELFKRIHFVLWTCWIVLLYVCNGFALQGVPTWICLGLKSPFIEFKAEAEVLSNVSVSLNSSTTEKGLNRNKNGVQNLGPFIYPINDTVSGYNGATGSSISGVNSRNRGDVSNSRKQHVIRIKNKEIKEMGLLPLVVKGTDNPVFEAEMNNKKEVTIVELKSDDNDYQEEKPDNERKYIIPLALKNPTQEPPRKSRLFQNSKTNIDDLKRHILMLQNLTKNDQNFQSKFVVFPNLQRNNTELTTTIRTTTTKMPISFSIPKQSVAKDILRGMEEVKMPERPVTIIPQVFLQNDQTPMSDESFSPKPDADRNERRRLRKKLNSGFRTTTPLPFRRQKSGLRRNKTLRKRIQCRDGYIKHSNCTKSELYTNPPTLKSQMKNFTDSFDRNSDQWRLSRTIRSNNERYTYQQRNGTKDLLFPVSINPNQTNSAYREHVDLNPDLCYNVTGLSYGQQKLCVLHTHIMPAISRGARAAIQECKYQFRNRRWNCSTIDDDTVFGPISGVGSPEMAFVHAIAAAGAASFIARACRDGQLTSCGCSRSSRPKQLHEDWTWGGCGDDLEFGYKFAQDFIDIREKEKKRGTRGLITIPQKTKLEEKLLSESSNDTLKETETNSSTVSSPVKSEDLLELQEKITKEILSSKLQEKEMQELQEKINKELLNSKVFNLDVYSGNGKKKQHRIKVSASAKARSMMNLHNNEAGRRAVIKKSRITCKCHGVSGSCSLITCWQQLTSMREIGEHLRVKYDEATQVKLNKRGRLQVKDPRYKVPSALDLVYLDESPDWCRANKQLQWQGTHNRICNKTSSGLDGCAILCCGRGYNTKKIVVKERCNCKFHWCCQVKCEICVKVIEEYSCK